MKMTQIKRIMLYTLFGIISIPAFTFADEPVVGGGSATGADSAATTAAIVGGGSATGADSNTSSAPAPTDVVVGGGSATGANSNTSSNPAPTNVVVGGGSATGADSNTSSAPAPTDVVVGGGSATGADANTSSGSTDNGGGNTSGGGGTTYSSGGTALVSSASISTTLASTSCNYLTSYLKIDGNNDSAQVTKLQTFLKNVENINVDINGTFDQKTFEGVKAFQAKYLEETMRPWGSVTPSGQVFFTTQKKINEVYCKSPFALTEAQLAQINAYKNSPVQGTTTAEGNIGLNSSNINATGTIPVQPEVGSINNDNGSQTASAANTSVGTKIWNFIKWLFGYNN